MAGGGNDIKDWNTQINQLQTTKPLTISELRALAQQQLDIIKAEDDAEAEAQLQTEADLRKYSRQSRKDQRTSGSPSRAAFLTMVPNQSTMPSIDNSAEMTKGPKLRSAGDVLDRLKWDPSIKIDEYHIGYLERFEGIKEMPAARWVRESTDEDFIPQHRIKWIKRRYVGDEEVVWDREGRIDHIFGSGFPRAPTPGRADLESIADSIDGGVPL